MDQGEARGSVGWSLHGRPWWKIARELGSRRSILGNAVMNN